MEAMANNHFSTARDKAEFDSIMMMMMTMMSAIQALALARAFTHSSVVVVVVGGPRASRRSICVQNRSCCVRRVFALGHRDKGDRTGRRPGVHFADKAMNEPTNERSDGWMDE